MTSVTGDLTSDVGGDQVRERGRRSLEIGSGEPLVTFRSMSGDLHVGQPRAIDQTPAAPARSVARAPQPTQPAPANGAIAAAYDDARLRILRSLERGEIDVAEAGRRLETLDAGDVAAPAPGSSPGGGAGGDAEGAAGGDDERPNP